LDHRSLATTRHVATHRADHHQTDTGVGEDVPEAHRLLDRLGERDHVAQEAQQIVVGREVMFRVRVVLQLAEEPALVRGTQGRLRHRHAAVGADHEQVAEHAGQDHREAEDPDVHDREQDQESEREV
jgi:hypothetical protein